MTTTPIRPVAWLALVGLTALSLARCAASPAALAASAGPTGNASRSPNVVFIFTDDQQARALGAFGGAVATPRLDRLVASGTAFTNAYIEGSHVGAVCAPSRAMLMTGRHLAHVQPDGLDIDPAHTTLPGVLGAAGYHTVATGKWHNGEPAFLRSFTEGRRVFFGGMHDHYGVPVRDLAPGADTLGAVYTSGDVHSTDWFGGTAIAFLDGYRSSRPFFLYAALTAPHDPRQAPPAYLDRYDEAAVPLPPNFATEHPFDTGELDIRDEWTAPLPRTPAAVRREIAGYDAMITHLDAEVGRIVEAVQRNGFGDNTVVVFASDNGLALGAHGLMGKQNLYEESVRVPLVFAGPGVPAGVRSDALVTLQDVFPTLAEMAGVPIPPTVEGRSLVPVLRGGAAGVRESVSRSRSRTRTSSAGSATARGS